MGLPRNNGNRFDDPIGRFWVLYAAEQRRGCFLETLAGFRPDLELLAKLQNLPDGDVGEDLPDSGVIPDDWHLKRVVGTFRVTPGQRWLDLRSLEDREAVRRALASTLLELSHADFDMSDALSRDRQLTQKIARWAYDQGRQGVIYSSRMDAGITCWAIFEGAGIRPGDVTAISADDPDLIAVADALGLIRPATASLIGPDSRFLPEWLRDRLTRWLQEAVQEHAGDLEATTAAVIERVQADPEMARIVPNVWFKGTILEGRLRRGESLPDAEL